MTDAGPTSLQPIEPPNRQQQRLRDELRAAQQELVEAEAELAREQAAVNAFRMHARLMLDDLVDAIHDLLARKQALLTRLELLRQEHAAAADATEDPFGPAGEEPPEPPAGDDELPLMPTDVPRDKAAEKRLYRELARRFHPDLANSAAELAYRTSVMTAVNAAYTAGDVHTLYDLAGELEPGELAELGQITTREVRQLRERLMQCRRRQRKVRRQLQTLRHDNTARLWRKAQELDDASENWWAAVRRDLEATKAKLEGDVASLAEQVAALEPEETDESAGAAR